MLNLVLILGASGVLAGDDQDPARWQRLRTGDAVIEATQTDRSGGAVRVAVLMYTDPERLWALLLSCERSFEFVDGLRECESLGGDTSHKRLRNRVKTYAWLPPLDYVVEFDLHPYELIEFRQVEGDLEVLEGKWRFERLQGSEALLVTHELRVRPSFPVPHWFIRRSIAKDVPNLMLCLRALAGGSPDASRAQSDRASCPSDARLGRD